MSIHAGQPDVRNDNVEELRLRDGQRLGGAVNGRYFSILQLQQQLQRLQNFGRVVDEQYPHTGKLPVLCFRLGCQR